MWHRMFEALPAGKPLQGFAGAVAHTVQYVLYGIASVLCMKMLGIGTTGWRIEWQRRAGLDAWLVEPSRRAPHCATLHATYKKDLR